MSSVCSIPLRNLPQGTTIYTFQCGHDFFAQIEDSLIDDAHIVAQVVAVRSERMIKLTFNLSGTICATCDICLGQFDYPIESDEQRMTLRLGDHFEEIDDELCEVDETADEVDLSQWIYEFVCICLPIRFEHPADEDGNSTCDPEMLKQLEKYSPPNQKAEDENQNTEIDPRWAALAQLKNK